MFKRIISYALSTALIFESSMVWGQKSANPPHILYDSAKEYMRDTGLAKKEITYGEWFKKSKKYLDPEVGGKIEHWVKQNANKKMPTFEILRGKKTEDKTILTITAKQDGKSMSLNLVRTETETYFMFQGRKYTYSALYYGNLLDKIYGSTPFLSGHKLMSINKKLPKTTVKYIKAVRDYLATYESYQDVFAPTNKVKKVSMWEPLLPFSYAAKGPSCLLAGWWLGELDKKNGHCKEVKGATVDGDGPISESCPGQFHCNPTLFGEMCVEKTIHASMECKTKSDGNIQEISNKIYEDPGNWEKLQENARETFDGVISTCLSTGSETVRNYSTAITENRKLTDSERSTLNNDLKQDIKDKIAVKCRSAKVNQGDCNSHNREACENTVNRIFDLLQAKANVPTQEPVAEKACEPIQMCPVIPITQINVSCLCQQTKSTPAITPATAVTDTSVVPVATNPTATTDGGEKKNEEPGMFSSVGNFFSNPWSHLFTGLVAFGAAIGISCGFEILGMCADPEKEVKIIQNTKIVKVPVPGPIQYFVPPEVPVPPADLEEPETPRDDGQGAR
jgi:hypothetical protein